jgi:predicted nuclease of predicted toxin-antitoxin system
VRFLANENFPGDAVTALRAAGHDLAWVLTDAPGSPDPDMLARAVRENRVLLTFGKDFGELAWRAGLPATSGIVLFRLPMPSPADVGSAIAGIIGSREDWGGQFSVVEPGRIRMRSLPSRS